MREAPLVQRQAKGRSVRRRQQLQIATVLQQDLARDSQTQARAAAAKGRVRVGTGARAPAG